MQGNNRVCSEIHTEHVNTICGQDIEFLNVKSGSMGPGVA